MLLDAGLPFFFVAAVRGANLFSKTLGLYDMFVQNDTQRLSVEHYLTCEICCLEGTTVIVLGCVIKYPCINISVLFKSSGVMGCSPSAWVAGFVCALICIDLIYHPLLQSPAPLPAVASVVLPARRFPRSERDIGRRSAELSSRHSRLGVDASSGLGQDASLELWRISSSII